MRSMQDVKDLLSTPYTGTCETGAPYGRCLLKWLVPNIKEVVILRPVEEVMTSLLNIDFDGEFTFDSDKLRKILIKGDRALKRIAKDNNVMVINFHDLDKEEFCQQVFEFCLSQPFDKTWWENMKDKNIQIDFKSLLWYRIYNKPQIDDFKNLCKRELIRLCRLGEIKLNGRNSSWV